VPQVLKEFLGIQDLQVRRVYKATPEQQAHKDYLEIQALQDRRD
jgi:hypothetical protein